MKKCTFLREKWIGKDSGRDNLFLAALAGEVMAQITSCLTYCKARAKNHTVTDRWERYSSTKQSLDLLLKEKEHSTTVTGGTDKIEELTEISQELTEISNHRALSQKNPWGRRGICEISKNLFGFVWLFDILLIKRIQTRKETWSY